MGSMGSPERQPAHVMVIVANETPTLPTFKSYTKNLPMTIHIKKASGKLSAQSRTEVFRMLLQKNENVLRPTQGLVIKSIELQGYHNSAPFDFAVELTINTAMFSNSSSSPNIYGLKPTKNYSRTGASSFEDHGDMKKEKRKGGGGGGGSKNERNSSPSNLDENEASQIPITCKFDFRANTLSNIEEETEKMFRWQHEQYKIMSKFANFNFAALSGSSIRGTAMNAKGGDGSSSLALEEDPSLSMEEQNGEERGENVPAATTSTTTTTTVNVGSAGVKKKRTPARSQERLEELHLTSSPMHHLILSLINSELAKCSDSDEWIQKLSHYSTMLKYGVDNETIDAEAELKLQLLQKQQQQQQTTQQQHQQQQQQQKKYVFINGALCEEIRTQVKRISDTIRYAIVNTGSMKCKIILRESVHIDEGDDYHIPFWLKVEYMHVPFNNLLESK